ncbi:MAG: putative DNA-binding domain-containing protein [Planctomycetota bacterium]
MPRASVDRATRVRRPELVKTERWFQAELARPHEGGKAGAPASASILPSKHLRPEERVAIYSGMYFARLYECLADDYPALVKLSGRETFGKIARAYLAKHPSRHYSLNFLGRKLPEFLDGPLRIPRRALLADVARVERAISESFDAAVSSVMTPADMALVPPAVWETGRVRLTESLRLLALDHRANAIVSACRQEKELPSLARKKTWVAVYRKEWTVWRADLTEPMHAVLAALRAGKPLGAALAAAARRFEGTPEEMKAEVHRWFGEWAREGLFAAVER